MLSQRIAQQTLRRMAAQQPASRLLAPTAAIRTSNAIVNQRRWATAQPMEKMNELDARNKILAQQRLNRPVAPHLAIYKPQITWYSSIIHRITGCLLSGGFYVFGALYLIAPALGWHLESSVLAAGFASWPVVLQFLSKFAVGWTFTFKCFNGMRHLIWDTATMMTNKQVNQSGWFAVGASALSALALCFL
ncbi:hypothetical protein D0869_11428 [Hortaea werneckii]|uniref:Succinate dehydrogenase cytochrome b560 subunit n=1 Tax=Hortaea werneckii TaxID=91943 RepID=A0A3M6WAL8_HORWE|nr:hypothetical protein KC324_g9341 [Hortaea werneckii]KAI7579687.1 hypothetical protein KC316_g9340 [Hortaea werneckii]RMX75647.1 hypothetical protein D0869_11428 [Hortaea werneckii]